MSPSRNSKSSGRYRSKHQSCRRHDQSTSPTIRTDTTSINITSLLSAMKSKGIEAYSAQVIQTSDFTYKSTNSWLKAIPSSRTLSTPSLRSLCDTHDIEGFPHRRCSTESESSNGSFQRLRRQVTSTGSLTTSLESSYSSLEERSTCTFSSPLDVSCLKQSLPDALRAIFDSTVGYEHDLTMRKTVEEIVSQRATFQIDVEDDLAFLDPSVLIALPGSGPEETKKYSPEYEPTDLCDLSRILSSPEPIAEDSDLAMDLDLDLLRVGSSPVDDSDEDDLGKRGWDIPEHVDHVTESLPRTTIPYELLSEASESESEDNCLPSDHLKQSHNSSFSSSWAVRSRSSSSSSARNSSDYLADVSSEETTSGIIIVWPPTEKLKLRLEEVNTPFVLPPPIPGVPYCGIPTSILAEREDNVSTGLEAFFKNRSIMHRLGPHGLERVYDMEQCPERCGFAYPVPPKEEENPKLKN